MNAERSVICGGAAHRVRLSQEGEEGVVTIAVAFAVTTTVTIVVEGGAATVVASRAVVTSVRKMVVIGTKLRKMK